MVSTTSSVVAFVFAAVLQLAIISQASAACVPLASSLLSPCGPSLYPTHAPYMAPLVIRDSSVANGLVDVMQLMVASDLMQNNLGPCLPLCAAPVPPCCPHLPACAPVSPYAPYYPYYL